MPNQSMQNYLEDFSVDGLDKLSPFLQDAFSRIKYAFNSRLNFKDCSFTVDFAKEELASFVSSALKEEERVWKYENDVIHHLNNLSLTREEFNFRWQKERKILDRKVPDFVLWYYRYLRSKYDVRVQYTLCIGNRQGVLFMKEYTKEFDGVTYTFTESDLNSHPRMLLDKLRKDISEAKNVWVVDIRKRLIIRCNRL